MEGYDKHLIALKGSAQNDELIQRLEKLEGSLREIREVIDFHHSTPAMRALSLADRMQMHSEAFATLASGTLVPELVAFCEIAARYKVCHEVIQEATDRENAEAEQERQRRRDFQEFLKSRKNT